MSSLRVSGESIERKLGLIPASRLDNLRASSMQTPSPITMIVGSGIGALPAIEAAKKAGNKVVIFEREPAPGGRLRNVAAEKHHLRTGTTQLLQATTDGDVFTYYDSPVALDDNSAGIPITELVDRFKPSHVYLATGTQEQHTSTPTAKPIDYCEYKNHAYAYGLTRTVNDHIGRGERLGTLNLDFNQEGDTVLIVGAGLVGLEDLPAATLAWQIDRLLLDNDIVAPDGFDYLKFTAKPLRHLKEMFNTIVSQNLVGRDKMIELFGEGFGDLKNEQVVSDILHRLGIKETIVIYRGTQQDILNKPHTKIRSGTLVAFPKIHKYKLLLQTMIESVQTENDVITEITLTTPDGAKTIKPAYITHAIGGTAPEVVFGNTTIHTRSPVISNGALFSHMGNVILRLGNMEAAVEQSEIRLNEIAELDHEQHSVSPDIFNAALAWMAVRGYIPANPACAVARSYPEHILREWGWD